MLWQSILAWGIEVWSLPGQAWITVRLNTCCVQHSSTTDTGKKVRSWHQDKIHYPRMRAV